MIYKVAEGAYIVNKETPEHLDQLYNPADTGQLLELVQLTVDMQHVWVILLQPL